MAAIEQRDYAFALRHLNRTCELLPEAITPRQWRAYLLAETRDYAGAIEDANWVIERKGSVEAPIDEDFRLLRAEWLYRAKHYDDAIADCSLVIERDVNCSRLAYGLRSACHEEMGNFEIASADQAKFLERTAFDGRSLNMAADPMSGRDISLRHPTIALRVVRKIQSLNLEMDEELEHTIGRVLYRNDLHAEAVEWIEQCLSRGAGEYDGMDRYVLAMAYQRLGKLDAAQKVGEAAESWKPPKPLDIRSRCDLRALANECSRLQAASK